MNLYGLIFLPTLNLVGRLKSQIQIGKKKTELKTVNF